MAEIVRKRLFKSSATAVKVLNGINLNGKTFAITGTTSGIGIETARSLALNGAHIVMMNRNLKQSEALKNTILKEKPDAKIDIITCDLNSLKSVESAGKEYLSSGWPLHSLILNAGIFAPSAKTTSDGFESQFGVNHLAHFLLVRELLPVLRSSAPSRIVVVASLSNIHTGLKPELSLKEKVDRLLSQDTSENFYKLYAYSKMCNILMAFKLHRDEFEKNNISVYALHPGMIKTEIWRDLGLKAKVARFFSQIFLKNLGQGAATQVYCATHPELEQVSGKYWSDCWDDEKGLSADIARDFSLQEEIWHKSEKMINEALRKSH